MIRCITLLLAQSLLIAPAVHGAGTPEAMKPEHLVGTYEKLVKMKADAADEIRRLDGAIEQNNRTIAKAEDIRLLGEEGVLEAGAGRDAALGRLEGAVLVDDEGGG